MVMQKSFLVLAVHMLFACYVPMVSLLHKRNHILSAVGRAFKEDENDRWN
ncbi:hypothetical protein E2C01_067246 [Portunus trituberculatus]|uniref:Uncharacterized protein n=1 Tax=Portunus trituberculatus TaxID=210409 RepID=A0A5B7HNL8_PORTR|nr:hypothetical protein [Portunus trituberculatus]